MQNKKKRKQIELIAILILCAATLILDFVSIPYLKNEVRNAFLNNITQQACGATAVLLLIHRLELKLFGRPQALLYLIPCLIVAIDNFQFYAYFSGKMQLVHTRPIDFLLFSLNCIAVGLFEEGIFRGILFSVLAGIFTQDKKGLWKTYIYSSVIFGLAHLFNGISMATILQVGYTTLTGGLFAFVLLKSKNILCCAFVHGVYNFCGLLFDVPARMGLGAGGIIDLGTAITMLIVSILAIIFVLHAVYKYSEEERAELYEKLAVPVKSQEK